ncbi:MAG: carbohydrate kinase [Bacteroidales bacterium]|nr:carbohydrate kinase [Bacteroidales bacterium]
MKKEAILVFDIGKTNKKVLLFDEQFSVLHEEETRFDEVIDDDGFPCDDIVKIEKWINDNTLKFLSGNEFEIKAINFTTYGATVMHIDKDGNAITPVYNYLKTMPVDVIESLCSKYGGIEEFGRKTGSKVMGMLNSGLQIYWLKLYKHEIYRRIWQTLHFSQYFSFKLTGVVASEYTSLGCHTALWDFDKMNYHPWLKNEGINNAEPLPANTTFPAKVNQKVLVGIGIHDSSASLVPFLESSREKFVLLSTGTWFVSMNPFNHTPLTFGEMQNNCLCYMSIREKPVKSSLLYLGHVHDVNTARLEKFFNISSGEYKKVVFSEEILRKLNDKFQGSRLFFKQGIPENHLDDIDLNLFESFAEAYHQLIIDLSYMTFTGIKSILENNDQTKCIYITGGFARNEIFTKTIASFFSDKKVYISEVYNATSLGAALVLKDCFSQAKIIGLI